MNIFKRFFSNIFRKPHIPEEVKEYCYTQTAEVNRKRFGYLVPLVIAAVTVIILIFVLDGAKNGFEGYLIWYIVTDAAFLLFIACCYLLYRTRLFSRKKQFNLLLYTVFFVSLVWTAVLSVLDKNMTTYIMALLLFSVAFVMKPRFFLIVEAAVLAPLSAVLPFLHMDGFDLLLSYINTVFAGLLSAFMSLIGYNSAVENVSNKKMIELKHAELNELVVRFKDLSETDSLTALLNRRKFDEILNTEWRRAIRGAQGLVLIIADVDFFKNYNDLYGHLKGDDCLIRIARVLKEKFKRANEFAARYGGEEFAIIMAGADESDGIKACERIIESVKELGIPHAASIAADVVTVSAGMAAIVPKADDSLEAFIDKADSALYEAKETGRNRYAAAKTD